MPQHTVEVKIKEGKVVAHVTGMPGDGCLLVTKKLEEALGSVESREMTAEAYETAETSQTLEAIQ